MNPEEMIDGYIVEVGSLLPKKGREDIQRELRSLIQDEVETRAEASDRDVSVSLVSDVLIEFGSPEEMAVQYRGEKYLIGPRWFPLFQMVATIVFFVLTAVHLVAFAVSYWGIGAVNLFSPGRGLVEAYLQAIGISFAIITLIFGLLERYYGSDFAPEIETEAWKPTMIQPADDPDRINRWEVITGVVFSILFVGAALIFLAPKGILGWVITDAFRPLLPLFVASVIADGVVSGLVAWRGRWTTLLRWLDIGQSAFGIFVIYRINAVPQIVTVTLFNQVLHLALTIVLIVMTVLLVIKIGKQLWLWYFGKSWPSKSLPNFKMS